MRSQVSLGTKLTASFAAMLAITLVLSYFSLSSVSTIKDTFDTAADKTKKIELADQINTAESDMLAWQRGMTLYAFVQDSAKSESAKQKFLGAAATLQKAVAEIKPMTTDPRAKEAFKRIEDHTASWVSHFQTVAQLCLAGKPDESVKYATEKTIPLYASIAKDADLVAQVQRETLARDKQTAAAQYVRSRWITSLLIGLGVVIGAVVLFTVRQSSGQLRQMAYELSQGSEQVASAAAQVSSSSRSLAQGASEQAASLEETSVSSEEMASMTRQNAESAKSATGLMVQTAESVGEANRTLEQMVKSMSDINTSSDKISKIVKVIDEIAFQTNILALNAAVEAARALIEESISKSGGGRTKLDEVAKSITAITENATKVKTLVDEVNLGSQEQARGIEQVSKAVARMEQVTQKTAVNAKESASASEEMAAQAHAMREIVERLQALVGGGGETHRRQAISVPVRAKASQELNALKAALHREHKPVDTAVKVAKAGEF